MHGFNYLLPHFISQVQGTRIVVTSQSVANVLGVPRVEFPDYPSYDHLKTLSKDELIFAFYEHPFEWGDRQFTCYSGFAKGPQFLNMVMTFILHPLDGNMHVRSKKITDLLHS